MNTLDDSSGRGRTSFVIHIDTKAEDMQKEMLEVFMDRPNVIVMEAVSYTHLTLPTICSV